MSFRILAGKQVLHFQLATNWHAEAHAFAQSPKLKKCDGFKLLWQQQRALDVSLNMCVHPFGSPDQGPYGNYV